jgi:hypothetical protein
MGHKKRQPRRDLSFHSAGSCRGTESACRGDIILGDERLEHVDETPESSRTSNLWNPEPAASAEQKGVWTFRLSRASPTHR